MASYLNAAKAALVSGVYAIYDQLMAAEGSYVPATPTDSKMIEIQKEFVAEIANETVAVIAAEKKAQIKELKDAIKRQKFEKRVFLDILRGPGRSETNPMFAQITNLSNKVAAHLVEFNRKRTEGALIVYKSPSQLQPLLITVVDTKVLDGTFPVEKAESVAPEAPQAETAEKKRKFSKTVKLVAIVAAAVIATVIFFPVVLPVAAVALVAYAVVKYVEKHNKTTAEVKTEKADEAAQDDDILSVVDEALDMLLQDEGSATTTASQRIDRLAPRDRFAYETAFGDKKDAIPAADAAF